MLTDSQLTVKGWLWGRGSLVQGREGGVDNSGEEGAHSQAGIHDWLEQLSSLLAATPALGNGSAAGNASQAARSRLPSRPCSPADPRAGEDSPKGLRLLWPTALTVDDSQEGLDLRRGSGLCCSFLQGLCSVQV